jgi:hypothetical protein
VEGGRSGRPCGPGAHSRAIAENQLAATPPFPHFRLMSLTLAGEHGGTGLVCGGGVTGAQDPPIASPCGTGRPQDQPPLTRLASRAGARLLVGRLVAASWRMAGDPVPSSRDAGEPAAAGHQGLVGPCRGACIALDGEPDRALGRQPGRLSGHKPLTAGDPAGRPTGCCTGAAAGGRAAGSAGTSGAAGHVGGRGCWRVSVASGSTAARPCPCRVAFLVHPTRSSGAAPPPAGLTAVRAWWMTGAG